MPPPTAKASRPETSHADLMSTLRSRSPQAEIHPKEPVCVSWLGLARGHTHPERSATEYQERVPILRTRWKEVRMTYLPLGVLSFLSLLAADLSLNSFLCATF